jgi:hypothetical protein
MDAEVGLTLRQLAATMPRPQAEIIREAILAYIKSAGRPRPRVSASTRAAARRSQSAPKS